jgi:hypothetical protein
MWEVRGMFVERWAGRVRFCEWRLVLSSKVIWHITKPVKSYMYRSQRELLPFSGLSRKFPGNT